MMRQKSRRIHSGCGFFGSFDASCFKRSWIDLFSKETQNPFSPNQKIQSWIFLKKRTLRLQFTFWPAGGKRVRIANEG